MKRPVKKEVYKPTAEQIGNGAYYRLKEIKGYNEAIAEYEAFLTSLQEIKNTTEHAIRNAIRVGFMTSPLMTLQECENKMLPEILKLLQAPVKEEKKECENCGHFYIPNLECHRPEGSCKTDKYEFWKPIPKEEKETVSDIEL